jgi:hypothetical protein
MSYATAIVLNAALDLAVMVALTWLMRVPFHLDRAVRPVLASIRMHTDDLRRAA